jgi:hypothetical protein
MSRDENRTFQTRIVDFSEYEKRIAELEEQNAKLRGFPENWRPLIDARKKIAELEEALRKAEEQIKEADAVIAAKNNGVNDPVISGYQSHWGWYSKWQFARIRELETKLQASEEALRAAQDALKWIATVNESIDLRKLDQKTLIGLIHELRAKAKSALREIETRKADQ